LLSELLDVTDICTVVKLKSGKVKIFEFQTTISVNFISVTSRQNTITVIGVIDHCLHSMHDPTYVGHVT